MWKTVRLYQRLYAFSKRTGSTATLQRIPLSEVREVGEPVGGRASHREAGAIGQEPTSGLEPLSCSVRMIIQALQRFTGACKSPYLRGYLHAGLARVAPYCVRGGVRVVSITLIFA
jgi:hypothetical protein